MGINKETQIAADLQIGPTSAGMVRIYVSGDSVDLPMDFEPAAAREIADELKAAADMAESAIRPPLPNKGKRRPRG